MDIKAIILLWRKYAERTYMNWKEQLEKVYRQIRRPYLFVDEYENAKEQDEASKQALEEFAREIIEKLIADIPDDIYSHEKGASLRMTKQQLRDKWL